MLVCVGALARVHVEILISLRYGAGGSARVEQQRAEALEDFVRSLCRQGVALHFCHTSSEILRILIS